MGAGTGMRPSRPEHESDELEVTPVVTCFLRAGGDVLLLRRSGEVGSYRGRWGAVAGYAEGDPDAAARREIEEETGLGSAVEPVRRGEPFEVVDRDLGKRWIVHPYLFDCSTREVTLDRESVECAWVPPTEILRRDVVPELWTSWRRVAPDEETVAADREHGSAWISLRALEVLRDRAGELAVRGPGSGGGGGTEDPAWRGLADLARRLAGARPAMAAPANRIHRAMRDARAEGGGAAAVERAAHAGIGRALAAERDAAARAAEKVAGRTVLTLSRSGTVEAALTGASPPPAAVVVAESRPGGEGIGVAERLAAAGLPVVLVPDAAVAWAIAEHRVEAVLVGADTVLPSSAVTSTDRLGLDPTPSNTGPPPEGVVSADERGRQPALVGGVVSADEGGRQLALVGAAAPARLRGGVCNKVGTRPAALTAAAAGVPVWAVAASDKVAPRPLEPPGERADPGELYAGGAAGVEAEAPLFETTPGELIAAVITERGDVSSAEVDAVAREMAELEDSWAD